MIRSNQSAIFSFFTGAGFLDFGFESQGFIPVFGNEISEDFCKVYRYSRAILDLDLPCYGLRQCSIDNFLLDRKDKLYLTTAINDAKKKFEFVGFIGGPPCPDFSVAGKNKGENGEHGRLSQSYMDLICKNKPDFFVFENVKGLWRTSIHRAFFDKLVLQAQNAGYATSTRLVNALEYGAPQDRDRIIFVGIKERILSAKAYTKAHELLSFPWECSMINSISNIKAMPWPKTTRFIEDSNTSIPSGIPEVLTVEYWFRKNDVENHPNGHDFFIPRAGLVKMKTYDEGDDSKKCFKRLHRWRYSPTVAYGNNEVHLHPYKARRLSVAEALALQSLPKQFQLPSTITLSAKFKTIGNGVPFLLASGVAKSLKNFLHKESKK